MVGNPATRLACEFQRTDRNGAVMKANMKPQGEGSIEGLPLGHGLDVRKTFLAFQRREVFLT